MCSKPGTQLIGLPALVKTPLLDLLRRVVHPLAGDRGHVGGIAFFCFAGGFLDILFKLICLLK